MRHEMCSLYIVEDTISKDVKICISNNPKERKNEIEELFGLVKKDIVELSLDLQQRKIYIDDKHKLNFKVDDHLIDRIIYGLDDVDVSLKEKKKILNFEKNRMSSKPWIYAND